MLDIHSHILPQIDDGAKSVEDAVFLLEDLKRQGCTHVIATPHFYAQSADITEFKSLFDKKFSELLQATKDKDVPVILPGCEVYYFGAISTCTELDKLTLNNSKYILLELPVNLTAKVLDSIIDINLNRGYTPIIAHIERYAKSKYYGNLLDLVDKGYALAQLNASSFLKGSDRRNCYSLIKNDLITYIASDAHSPKNRPVRFDKAFKKIEKKFGAERKQAFIDNSIALLNEIGIDSIE